MRRIIRVAIATGAILLLSSCQPPAPRVFAVLEQGRVVFHIRSGGLLADRIFGWNDDMYSVGGFSIERDRRLYWRLATDASADSDCKREISFPLVYAEERCGFLDGTGPTDLGEGGPYLIRLKPDEDWWSDMVLGAFFIKADGAVDNVRPQ